MEQRRITSRVATLQDAQIILPSGQHIACTVENISPAGVLLRIAAQATVPPVFDLVFNENGESVRCHLAWAGGGQVGAAFQFPETIVQAA